MSFVREGVKSIAYGLLSAVPDHILTKAASGDMWSRLRYLRDKGFRPLQIVDVGAYDGLWASRAAALFPDARLLMIEAMAVKQAQLEQVCRTLGPKSELEIGLVSSVAGQQVTFYEMETGSSIFEDLSDYPRIATSKTTTTLDDIVRRRGVAQTGFLKVDVQGAELEVLSGGAGALATAQLVLLELSVADCNKDAPHACDVMAAMRQHGFLMRDMADVRRHERAAPVHQFDALFVRQGFAYYD